MKKHNKALLVIDAQNDFMPGGSLAVTNGDKIIPIINKLLPQFDLVIFTKDWHPEEMDCFSSMHEGKNAFESFTNKQGTTDTLWPAHCVADTNGAKIHEDINMSLCKQDFYVFKKGLDKDYHPYSGFGADGLKEFLEEKGVEKTFIVGLALDYCVKDTAIDSAMNGFETIVVLDGTKPIDPNIESTLKEFIDAKVNIIENWELSMYNLL